MICTGEEDAVAMAHENNNPASVTMRVNTAKTTVDEAIAALKSEGFEVRRGEIVPESLISESGNPSNTESYKNGLITIQDESSMLPVNALDVEPGMKVLDMCAAPGGKTTHIAEKMNDEGEVYAHDIHEHKMKLVVKSRMQKDSVSIRLFPKAVIVGS